MKLKSLNELPGFIKERTIPKLEEKEKSIEEQAVAKLREKEIIIPLKQERNPDGSFKDKLTPQQEIQRSVFVDKNKDRTVIGYRYQNPEDKQEARRWDIGDLQTKPNFWTEAVKRFIRKIV